MTLERARDIVRDVSYFATMMVHAGARRRHGLGRRPLHRPHDHAVVRDHQDRTRHQERVVGVLHVPGRPCARLRRLRGHPRPDRRGTGRHRHLVGGHRRPVRDRTACGDAVVLHRRVWNRRRRRQGQGRDGARQGATSRSPRRRSDPVRRRRGCRGRRGEAAGLRRRRPCDRVHLPRPQHRQQHVQGGPAIGRRSRRSARSCRASTSRSTTSRGRNGPRHRQHRRHHRDPGVRDESERGTADAEVASRP